MYSEALDDLKGEIMKARAPYHVLFLSEYVVHLKNTKCLGGSKVRLNHKPTCTVKHLCKSFLGKRLSSISGRRSANARLL